MTHIIAARSRLTRRLPGVLMVALAVALLVWLVTANVRSNTHGTFVAFFEDSSPLTEGNEVRMNGALIGTIKHIDLVDGKSRLTMSIDRSVLPLHEGTTAKVEPVSLLGERFVAVRPGPPSAPVLAEPVTLDAKYTSSAVDLDQVLNTLDDPTSTALAAMVTTLGQGLEGNGDNAAKALRGLEPTFREVDAVSRMLDQQNALLDHFVVQVQRTVDQVAPPMDSLVDSANLTLGTVSANRQALTEALGEAPATLASARAALTRLHGTAENATGVLHDIRPMTDDLRQVSDELRDFSDAASPALDSLPDVMHKLNSMLDEARPVAEDLVPMARSLRGSSDGLNGVGMQLFRHPRGQASQFEHLLTVAGEWSLLSSAYDGTAHRFRAALSFEPNTLASLGAAGLPAMGDRAPFNPIRKDPRGQSGGPGSPGVPQVPAFPLLTPETGPHKGNPPNYPGGPRGQGSFTDGASGLTPKQEDNLFSGFVGGGR